VLLFVGVQGGRGGGLENTVPAKNVALFIVDKFVVELFVTFAVGRILLILVSEHRWC
jgi:hypothetical protein